MKQNIFILVRSKKNFHKRNTQIKLGKRKLDIQKYKFYPKKIYYRIHNQKLSQTVRDEKVTKINSTSLLNLHSNKSHINTNVNTITSKKDEQSR